MFQHMHLCLCMPGRGPVFTQWRREKPALGPAWEKARGDIARLKAILRLQCPI